MRVNLALPSAWRGLSGMRRKEVTFHQSDDFPELSVPAMMLYHWAQGPSTVYPLLLTDQLLAREFEHSPIKSYKLTQKVVIFAFSFLHSAHRGDEKLHYLQKKEV